MFATTLRHLGCPVLEHRAGPDVALQVLDGAAAAAGPGLVLMEQAELPTAVALGPALAVHCTCFGGKAVRISIRSTPESCTPV